MKELLYVPTGQYFKFFSCNARNNNKPSASIEEYLTFMSGSNESYGGIIDKVLIGYYLEELYIACGIFDKAGFVTSMKDNSPLCKEEFELVDVED